MTDTITHGRASRPQAPNLLSRLVARGDAISIERGQLIIMPASSDPVPPNWLAQNRQELTLQILQTVGMDAFHYVSHKSGRYEGGKQPGLTIQLQSVATGADAYAIFNVELTRSRTTKAGNKGDPLPAGQFHPPKGGSLSKFWQSTGLPLRRLAAMHDYMGNLKGILFYASQTADRTDGRLIASTLQTLSLSASVIHQAVLPDNARTGWPDKHLAPAQQLRDVQVFLVREQIATVKR
ncbi:hypothetical protein NSA60_14320 [Pseudomonas oleovorans]|uniref:Uncharacterized protein n=1 Tax=Ectopseudomonas oleovorans TaxID=301 RepID=A0A2S7FM52_ECTOL|nr:MULTISPECIES: hypothetical protein [Pseudomonas aeruginosa group]MCR1827857.1 hypothetical protein [Pseudomonas oleovorans]MDH0568451.1 hypothetical protein [Pseudomonas oleovorans]PPV39308.1 hypothetical protein C5L43_11755 [Pseudomonas oleovorans]TXR36904.1 hypothetical protein FVE88_18280 [Pseudomonas mendocina]